MASHVLEDLIRQVDSLPPKELSELASYVAEKTAKSAEPRHKWAEIRGKARYPIVGEDAQTWVSRHRRESDERRALDGEGGA